ncbi:MAG: hypothetical protein II007_07675 [Gammaproteobacteria bacterium]|nr:hypothetical protein [Gammaproteobacteria bacterium]
MQEQSPAAPPSAAKLRPLETMQTKTAEMPVPTSAVSTESQIWACEQDGVLVVRSRRYNEQCRPYANSFATTGGAPAALATLAPMTGNSGSHRQPDRAVQAKPACQWLHQRLLEINMLLNQGGIHVQQMRIERNQRRSEWLNESCTGPAP